ncbi:hypothetical protein M0R45_010944 [Rubus argutus]|uniref:Uncharacterized protein n=1 Tax=Rubus argutus TaxID=59490 RepID=A0AAW1Y9M7_RUBAR
MDLSHGEGGLDGVGNAVVMDIGSSLAADWEVVIDGRGRSAAGRSCWRCREKILGWVFERDGAGDGVRPAMNRSGGIVGNCLVSMVDCLNGCVVCDCEVKTSARDQGLVRHTQDQRKIEAWVDGVSILRSEKVKDELILDGNIRFNQKCPD